MNIKNILLIVLVFVGFNSLAQSDTMNVYEKDYANKLNSVTYYYEYNSMETMIMAENIKKKAFSHTETNKLHFCLKTEEYKNWFFCYGEFIDNVFVTDMAGFYNIYGKSTPSDIVIDNAIIQRYALALKTAFMQINGILKSTNMQFDYYIMQNDNLSFTVSFFPTSQLDDLYYGGEFIYTIDATGTKVLEDNSFYKGEFIKVSRDKELDLHLDYTELYAPSMGAVYFYWFYRNVFKTITIDTK